MPVTISGAEIDALLAAVAVTSAELLAIGIDPATFAAALRARLLKSRKVA
jgi:hypothetical protein